MSNMVLRDASASKNVNKVKTKLILVPLQHLITPTILDYKQSLSGLCPKIAIVCQAVPIVEYYSNTSKVSGHLFRPSVNLFK